MTLEPFIEVILQIWSINEKWVVPNTCDQRIYVTLDAHRKWLFGKTFTVWVRVCCYFFFSSHSSPYLNASIVPFSINQWKLFSVVYWNANYYTKRPMYMLNDWYLMWGEGSFYESTSHELRTDESDIQKNEWHSHVSIEQILLWLK